MASTDLPDINVWLALSAPGHPMRQAAERYWREQAAERVALNTVTMLGLVRILTAAPVVGGEAIAPHDAWSVLRGWMGLSQVVYLYEPGGCRMRLDDLVSDQRVTPRGWTDAYLAAFAMAAGLRVVSFDADFGRYPALDLLHLAV